MNIFLIGYRASGKSSVGKLLAEKLGMSFIDTDDLVEERAEKTIGKIFEAQGEGHFRNLESEAVNSVCKMKSCVVALGGGAVLKKENLEKIKNSATVILLKASPGKIVERLEKQKEKTLKQRPTLTGKDVLEEVEEVLIQRADIYSKAADYSIETDSLSPEEVAGKAIEFLKERDLIEN